MCTFSRLTCFVAAVLSFATAAFAEVNKPPAELTFLSGVLKLRDDWVAEHYVWDELHLPPMNGEQDPVKSGRYWRVWGDAEKAKNAVETWTYLKPVFLANGWTVVKEPDPGRSPGIGQYARNGTDAWAVIDFYNNRLQLNMVEVASPPFTLTLTLRPRRRKRWPRPTRATFLPFALGRSKFAAAVEIRVRFG